VRCFLPKYSASQPTRSGEHETEPESQDENCEISFVSLTRHRNKEKQPRRLARGHRVFQRLRARFSGRKKGSVVQLARLRSLICRPSGLRYFMAPQPRLTPGLLVFRPLRGSSMTSRASMRSSCLAPASHSAFHFPATQSRWVPISWTSTTRAAMKHDSMACFNRRPTPRLWDATAQSLSWTRTRTRARFG